MTELPDTWKWSTIGEVADIVRGVTYSKGDTLSATDHDAVPLLRATNLEVDSIDFEDMVYVPKRVVKAQQYLQLDDIFLAASSGSISVVGKSAQVVKTKGETFGAFCAVIRPKNIHPKFLAYWVQSPAIRDHWSATAKGTNINNLKPSDISETNIPVPSIDEQHKIVELLEDHLARLNAALADVKQSRIKAAQFRRSLLQAAFTGNLGSGGTSFKTELPSDWSLVTLNEAMAECKNGLTYRNNPELAGFPVSRIETISKGEIDFEKVGYGGVSLDGNQKHLLNPGDILFSHINSLLHVGKVAIYKSGMPALLHGMNLLRITPNDCFVPEFLFYLFQSSEVRKQIWSKAKHAVNQASINIGELKTVVIPKPPFEEQHKIVELLEGHLSRLDISLSLADAIEKQTNGLRRSLLQAAFTGQLTKEVASV
jgi:type I restriction enzyme, S subunit